MNKYIIQWCLTVFIFSFSGATFAAPKGICTSDNGAFHSTLDFSGYLITADENQSGRDFNKTVTNGDSILLTAIVIQGKWGSFLIFTIQRE